MFTLFISVTLRTKMLSYDLNAFWFVQLASCDATLMWVVATVLETAEHSKTWSEPKAADTNNCSSDL